jgi:adenylate cyclase
VHGLLPPRGAERVKTIGDAVMLRCADPGEALRLGLAISEEVGRRHGFPSVRVGMHTGSAVERDGDWFGAAVNLAARVSDAAAGGEVLLTAATRRAAGDLPGVVVHERGRRELRNVAEPVELFAAHREGRHSPAGLPIDPVCRMAVDPEHEAGRVRHEGVEYHFCSMDCIRAFVTAPERHTGP